MEEQMESLMARCTGLEKQKSRLQSEVEVLIIDLEKVGSNTQDNPNLLFISINSFVFPYPMYKYKYD
jgi:hypothetical protein